MSDGLTASDSVVEMAGKGKRTKKMRRTNDKARSWLRALSYEGGLP